MSSAPSTTTVEVKGFPKGCDIASVFDDSKLDSGSGTFAVKLDQWGSAGLRFNAPAAAPAQRWKSADGREMEAQFGDLFQVRRSRSSRVIGIADSDSLDKTKVFSLVVPDEVPAHSLPQRRLS